MLQCSCATTALMPYSGPSMRSQNVAGTGAIFCKTPLAMMACTATARVKRVPIQLSVQPSELLRS